MKILQNDTSLKDIKERRYKLDLRYIPTPNYPTRGNNFPIIYLTNSIDSFYKQ